MLNSYQQAAVDAALANNDSFILEAAPGSGKTFTLREIAQAISAKSQPLLATSFVKKVVEKLREEVGHIANIRTLHSIGCQMLLRAFPKMSPEVDQGKCARHLFEAVRASKLPVNTKGLAAMLPTVKLAKANLTPSAEAVLALLAEEGPWLPRVNDADVAAVIFDTLRRCGTDEKTMDFDDMLWMPHVRGLSSPAFAQYHTVLADEVNDFTPVQIGLALNLGNRFIGVGDGQQQLYAWAGADKRIFSRLRDHLHGQTLSLPISYRCAKKIAAEGARIGGHIQALDDAPEGEVRWASIDQAAATLRPGDYVLARTNTAALSTWDKLTSLGVAAWIDGRTFASKLEAWADEAALSKKSPGAAAAKKGAPVEFVQVLDKLWTRSGRSESGYRALIESAYRPNSDGAVIMTVHQAKGRQAPAVYVMNSTFYNNRDDDETRSRLLYVAVTRAESCLVYVEEPS